MDNSLNPTSEILPKVTDSEIQSDPIQAEDQIYKLTPKFNLFVKYYTDQREKETFGNGTQSVIKAYSLDPVEQYAVAKVMAHENITKLNFLARDYMEEQGFTFQKMMDIAMLRVVDSKLPGWWDRLMEIAQYKKPKNDQKTEDNRQINVYNFNDPKVKDWNKKFMEFLASES